MIRGSSFTARLFTAVLVVLGLSLTANLVGCGSSSTPPPTGITIQGPTSGSIDPGDAASFTATVTNDAHNAGVTWTLTGAGCTGSACGALSGSTTTGVIYTAPATVTTAFTVTITVTSVADSSITTTITLSVPANPTIGTAAGALAGGVIGTPYSVTLAGAGGITPYTWSVTQGALPMGLTLSTSGVISGTPTAAGTANFTVTLTDSGSPALTATAQFTIATAYPALVIGTTSLVPGALGVAYNTMLAASGGSGTGYTWAVTSGTALSAVGLSLSASGLITGTPNATETNIAFVVTVTDSAGNMATATLHLTVNSVVYQGQVLSGATPVSGATIQLYTVGNSGNGSAATPMLTQTVTTDGIGFFNLAGFYTCGQSSTGSAIAGTSNQVYLVATGGSTSLTSVGNGALAMVTAAGSCGNLTSTSFFTINEITTAAAAWALAPFSTSATNIGASATNTLGITNAFLDAALLANPATGAPATLPANLTVETAKLAAFADVLNTCTASADGTGCNTLFAAATPANGTAPINSFNAALNIVQNPGQNVAAVYAVIPTTGTPPFATTLTASPNDWTMSLTVTGGGLSTPTALGIDSQNNVWVADETGPLSAFNAQGTPLSSTGYGFVSGVSIIGESFGLAIDPSNNIWVTNQNGGGLDVGYITEFYGVNNPTTLPTGTSPQPAGYDTNVYYPVSIAAATNGNIYVANTGTYTSVTIYNSSGNVIAPALADFVAISAGENSVAIDTSATNPGFWLSDNAGSVEHFSSTGTFLVNAACCAESLAIATDSAGDLWVTDYLGGADGHGAVAEAVTDGSGNTSVPISGLSTGGINYPQAVAVDAAQNVWFANKVNGSITEFAGINNTLAVGTAISPSTGVYAIGGYGLDTDLDGPYSLLPDRSGNLWVSNESDNNLTMFFGLAAPTVTPLQPVPTAP